MKHETSDMGDYFSRQSKIYSQARPSYPNKLFEYLAGLCQEHDLAWDCATGNGQAAVSISKYFNHVIASDLSEQQIDNATLAENVEYRVHRVEQNTLESSSVDLITAATAAHFFDLSTFYGEVDRILKPNGVLAIWSYAGCKIDDDINSILDEFAFEFLKDYWPSPTLYNWKYKYKTLPFPYKEINMPAFEATANYDFQGLENYLNSWSGVQRYITKHGSNPIDLFIENLKDAWGELGVKKSIRWSLFSKCGRKS